MQPDSGFGNLVILKKHQSQPLLKAVRSVRKLFEFFGIYIRKALILSP